MPPSWRHLTDLAINRLIQAGVDIAEAQPLVLELMGHNAHPEQVKSTGFSSVGDADPKGPGPFDHWHLYPSTGGVSPDDHKVLVSSFIGWADGSEDDTDSVRCRHGANKPGQPVVVRDGVDPSTFRFSGGRSTN